MTGSSDDSDMAPRRKKARRSCLNCQRSHRTCGDERPCMECKRRGMTETCVDGDRKIPKYLCDMSQNTPALDLYSGTSSLHSNRGTQVDLFEGTDHSKWSFTPVTQFGATLEDLVDPHRSRSSSHNSNMFVNPATLHIESPTLLLSRQTAKSHSQEKVDLEAQSLTVDVGSLSMPPVGSYDNREIESTLGGKTIGFTISSGWSSTFLPYEMIEEPGGSIHVS